MNDTEMIECREPALQMQRLIAIMKRLRAPHGCPWDAEQTHHSLISNMIEEAYEVVDTIQRNDWTQLREELGDVLLQVVFHAEIAQEAGRFDFNDAVIYYSITAYTDKSTADVYAQLLAKGCTCLLYTSPSPRD